jgi:16S rRNA (guanine(966)-N(2))-methyltransferase RsmD
MQINNENINNLCKKCNLKCKQKSESKLLQCHSFEAKPMQMTLNFNSLKKKNENEEMKNNTKQTNKLRIISGSFKGRYINSVEGFTSRPTTDFAREMIFSTLISILKDNNTEPDFFEDYFHIEPDASFFENANVLDLFAGSGSLGFEALSRGAKFVTFVDASKKSATAIITNCKQLEIEDKCKIIIKNTDDYLAQLETTNNKFNIIFADPPYDKDLVNPCIQNIFANNLLDNKGILIIEHSSKEKINDEYQKHIIKQKEREITTISFFSS